MIDKETKKKNNFYMWIDLKFVEIEKILKNEKGSLLDLGSRDQILKKNFYLKK